MYKYLLEMEDGPYHVEYVEAGIHVTYRQTGSSTIVETDDPDVALAIAIETFSCPDDEEPRGSTPGCPGFQGNC